MSVDLPKYIYFYSSRLAPLLPERRSFLRFLRSGLGGICRELLAGSILRVDVLVLGKHDCHSNRHSLPVYLSVSLLTTRGLSVAAKRQVGAIFNQRIFFLNKKKFDFDNAPVHVRRIQRASVGTVIAYDVPRRHAIPMQSAWAPPRIQRA